jgi:hypothetical protein
MKLRATPFALLAMLACAYTSSLVAQTPKAPQSAAAAAAAPANPGPAAAANATHAAGKKPPLPALPAAPAPAASPRAQGMPVEDLQRLIADFFAGRPGQRSYLQTDKPLYQPGETIWFKSWSLKSRQLEASDMSETTVELISPKGASVMKKRLRLLSGSANNDFVLPDEAQGGEYTLRATAADGEKTERAIIVAGYEAPRMKKKLEFVKKSYGAGDTVAATLELKRPTGEVLANKSVSAVVTLDGVELPRIRLATNAEGNALLKFDLPKTITAGDGLLTILVEDGGITESISKAIPILQKKLVLAFFPEGGKMVAGLPTRLYFEAKTLQGKPADVSGRLVDDLGHAVAKFATYKNGLGRLEMTPATGRSYSAEIDSPASVTEKYDLPLAESQGCVMQSFDDFDGQQAALRVQVRCSERQPVMVAASVRENRFEVATAMADSKVPAVLYLHAKDAASANAAGVARVTLFDRKRNPLAERLVFRNRRTRLQVQVEPLQKNLTPRSEVTLNVSTRDAAGKPLAAELALAVVDDTVLSFADDKSSHLLSRLLLEAELPGKIEEPNFYLDLSEAQSAMALDLLMGTRGYRRFEWAQVFTPPVQVRVMKIQVMAAPGAEVQKEERQNPAPRPALRADAKAAMDKALIRRDAAEEIAARNQKQDLQPQRLAKPISVTGTRVATGAVARAEAGMPAPAAAIVAPADGRVADEAPADRDFAKAARKMKKRMAEPEAVEFAAVRVFPIPAFESAYAGPRVDYRDTVLWAPSVKTGLDGKASVKFVLSDAVTSFRVVTEGVTAGVTAGLAGRDETVFKSSLPFSLAAKLPLEVSGGDQPLIPVTLTNDSNQALTLSLDSDFGKLMRPGSHNGAPAPGTLAAGQRKSFFIPLDVLAAHGQSQVRLQASANGLKDEVMRTIPVAPAGFPMLIEKSGQLSGQLSGKVSGKNGSEVTHEINLANANPGSVQASVRVYPSPLSTMISGLDGMLREPGGCFEQTSSTNYPNVMIMQYLKQHEVADPALAEKSSRLLETGYRKLSGFESKNRGYEWFGGDPGHEALSAYGLLEFIDMKEVSNSVDQAMLARTAAWLKSRRDGKGGYLRDAKQLDSFGKASPEVTNAYITWALVTAGFSDLEQEVAQSARLAESSNDAYQLALAAGTLLQRSAKTAPSKVALASADKLAKMQDESGAWSHADHSITRSGGLNLRIETTSLAVLALLSSGQHPEQARKGIAWLQNNRGGFGQWGATQATVLALKALIAYDNATRAAPQAGKVTLLIDGVVVAEQSYEAGRREPIVFAGFEQQLDKPSGVGKGLSQSTNQTGLHRITLRSSSGATLPYSIAIDYRSSNPATSAAAVIDLEAKLGKTELKMGETVRLDAVIRNKTQSGQPMTLARLGLPGGLGFQNWQLKEMREKGQIAFFETRAREVILYLREMKPGEVKKLSLDLVANVPGSYTGPASSGYLYYNDTEKSWAAPLKIRITP